MVLRGPCGLEQSFGGNKGFVVAGKVLRRMVTA
jgi:hypothetical protein